MSLTLTVRSEGGPGKLFEIGIGRTIVGRRSQAQIVFADDPYLSGTHFAIDWDGKRCYVSDLNSSNGTFAGGQRISRTEIVDGSEIRAGTLIFVFSFHELDHRPPPIRDDIKTPRDLPRAQPLFALLDAARNPLIPIRLKDSNLEYQSLYEGDAEAALGQAGPFLVRFPGEGAFLADLLDAQWGQACGIFFSSQASFQELRQHFRHFLMVTLESGRVVYFRFYDPRVLRVFLRECTPAEATQFFGGVDRFWVEGVEPGSLLCFEIKAGACAAQQINTGKAKTSVFESTRLSNSQGEQ